MPAQIVVVGGTAPSLGPSIGEYLNLPVTIPENAAVANAIGCLLYTSGSSLVRVVFLSVTTVMLLKLVYDYVSTL